MQRFENTQAGTKRQPRLFKLLFTRSLATELIPAIAQQIHRVQGVLYEDLNNPEYSGVWLPDALSRKYKNANKTLGWQYLFPSSRLSREPRTRLLRRHHLDETVINKVLKKAGYSAGITKQISSHTLRHSFMKYIHVFPPSGQLTAVQICS